MKFLTRTLMAIAVIAAVSACKPPAPPAPAAPDYAATLGPVVDKLFSVYNTRDYSQLDSIVTADFQRTAPDQNAASPAEWQAFVEQVHKAYPDYHLVMGESAFAKDLGFVRWTVTGTNTGDAATKATGKPVNVTGLAMYQFRDGRIAREYAYFDTGALATQLGASQMPHVTK
jgi:ketosteroid isomerase-like protein